MKILTESLYLSTRGNTDIVDLTDEVQKAIDRSGLKEGNVTLFVPGSTAAISTIEFEPGLLKDLPEMFDRVAPSQADYHHHDTWGDKNGSAHCRAPLVGPSLVIPFTGGRLTLGTWQQIVLFDFDDRPRRREVVCQILGLS